MICRNFSWLAEKLDTESGLISLLYQRNVLTVREKERISCLSDTFQKNEQLLGLLSKKSPIDFGIFVEALEELGQGCLAGKLRNPEGKTMHYFSDKPKRFTAFFGIESRFIFNHSVASCIHYPQSLQ